MHIPQICSGMLVLCGCVASAVAAEPLTFEQDIRPILRAHCYDCHGATQDVQGGLDLRLVRFMAEGGDQGPAIVPGSPDASLLLARIKQGEMPPNGGHVTDDEIATIEAWIAGGASTARPEPEELDPGIGITPEERAFWSFQPVRRPPVPATQHTRDGESIRTPIDAFIQAAMPTGLTFSPDADRATLIRRAYFDLIGLPPTATELAEWLDDPSDDWYDRLLDTLLASPHYGERWGRHWLDVAGFAESEGYNEQDAVRPWAWRYRDWVIRALNEDRPFDEFVTEQLAGDELAGPVDGELTAEQIELLTATGFLRMAADGTGSGANDATARNQVIADTLKIVGTSLLGLSVQCAQCHDHRYDPIPQTDYFALRAVFAPALDWQDWKTPQQRQVSLYTAADRQRVAEIEAEAQKVEVEKQQRRDELVTAELEKALLRVDDASLREPLRIAFRTAADKRSAEQNQLLATYPFVRQLSAGSLYLYNQEAANEIKKFDERIAAIRSRKGVEPFIRALVEPPGHAPQTLLFFRGDHEQPRQEITPAALTISSPPGQRQQIPLQDDRLPTTGRRASFAAWLTSGHHPLVARVVVNRIWLHHFGRGLVATPSDFGKLGTRPTHPELLDWLADELVRRDWSLKSLHRLILRSTVWRQASGAVAGERYFQPSGPPFVSADVPPQQVDPANHFYWRKPLVRLEAEVIRDRMLAVSGDLAPQMYGTSIPVTQDDAGQIVVEGQQTRRSVYIQVRRRQPLGMLQAFDAPVMETNCEQRQVTSAATQSLMLVNGAFILERAARLAERVAAVGSLEQQVREAWQLALSRPPTRLEHEAAMEFVDQQVELLSKHSEHVPDGSNPRQQAMTNFCQVLMSTNEFLYVD